MTAKRPLSGALLVDKEQGSTSAQVVRLIKNHFKLKRVGHSGTLDPMATGLLVVLCGKATRLQSMFLGSNKKYSGTIRLGLGTNTDDIEGDVTQRDEALIVLDNKSSEDILSELRREFLGIQKQHPPQFSAVKVQGQRSYSRARRGEQVELKAREIEIKELELKFAARDIIEYEVACTKGTYIRSLARDMGQYLGTCACLESIRRNQSSPFNVTDAISLETLFKGELQDFLIPIEKLVSSLPRCELSEEECRLLGQGRQEPLENISLSHETESEASLAALFDPRGQFCALLESSSEAQEGPKWRIRFMVESGSLGY